jgi:hypothetical protein
LDGGESFDYTVSDGRGGSDVATVDIDVVNRAPVAVDDRFTINPGGALSAGLLGNDRDPDADALVMGTGTITSAAGGTVTFYADGLFYTGHLPGSSAWTASSTCPPTASELTTSAR